MNRFCQECRAVYDDADRSTICPHELIMPAEDLAQKKLALTLMEKPIRFNHVRWGPPLRVSACSWNGMVTIHGMTGEFAPHLFYIVEE